MSSQAQARKQRYNGQGLVERMRDDGRRGEGRDVVINTTVRSLVGRKRAVGRRRRRRRAVVTTTTIERAGSRRRRRRAGRRRG